MIYDIYNIIYLYIKKKIYIYTIFLQTYLYTYKLTAISGCAEGLRRCCKGGRGVRKTPWLHDHDHDDLRHLVYKKIGQFLRFQHELRNIEMQAQPPTFFGLKRALRAEAQERLIAEQDRNGPEIRKRCLCFDVSLWLQDFAVVLAKERRYVAEKNRMHGFFATWTYQYHSTAQDFEQSNLPIAILAIQNSQRLLNSGDGLRLGHGAVKLGGNGVRMRIMRHGWKKVCFTVSHQCFKDASSVFEWLPFTWTHIIYFSVYTSQNLLFYSHQLPCARWPWSSPTRWWWASALISILRALLGMSQKWILGRKPIAVKRQHREPNLKRGPFKQHENRI